LINGKPGPKPNAFYGASNLRAWSREILSVAAKTYIAYNPQEWLVLFAPEEPIVGAKIANH